MIFHFSQPFIFQICGYAETAGKRTGKEDIYAGHIIGLSGGQPGESTSGP